jgi:hypothetical protein
MGEVRLHEGEIARSGAEHAMVAVISAWRPALSLPNEHRRGYINLETSVIRWMSVKRSRVIQREV